MQRLILIELQRLLINWSVMRKYITPNNSLKDSEDKILWTIKHLLFYYWLTFCTCGNTKPPDFSEGSKTGIIHKK